MQVSMFEMMYPTFKFNKKEITVLETFAGIGSQRKALDRIAERKNIDFNYLPPVEFDKYAIKSYNAIHGTNHNTKDITKTYGNEYGQIGIFTYSFPCQDISLAGNQKGFSRDSQTRSGLLWEVERILKEMKQLPKVLLMENVKNLISEKFINDFNLWQRELEKLGYSNYYQVLNAKDYGIPQNRERVFMISILGEYNYTFPQPIPLKLRLKDMLEDEVDEKYYLSDKLLKCFTDMTDRNGFVRGERFNPIDLEKQEYGYAITTNPGNRPTDNFIKETLCINSKVNGKQPSLQDRVYDSNGVSTAITTSFMPSIAEPSIVASRGRNPENPSDRTTGNYTEQRLEINSQGLCNTLTTVQKDNYVVEPVKETYLQKSVRETLENNNNEVPEALDLYNRKPINDGVSKTIGADCGHLGTSGSMAITNNLRIRKLTPLECFRLMGFDDEDYYKAAKVNSNTQLYKQCGNSIVVNVLEAIFEKLF